MKTLKQIIQDAEQKKIAVGHFNVSECVALKGIFKAAQELGVPVIIGVSEGEREFIGTKRIALMVQSLRLNYTGQIFLNADHTHSLEKIKEAVEAGFDAVLFDPTPNFIGKGASGGKLLLEENIKKTKEVVDYVKSVNPGILVEGELGYLGASSVILKEIPKDAAIKEEDLTKPEEAERFVRETGVDLLAVAVGNIHGMFKNAPNPHINIQRIKELRQAAGVPLVLHGGSGIRDEEFTAAIDAGISVIHISTELRLAWREGLEKAIKENPEEIVPYKLLKGVVEEVKRATEKRLKLFNRLV